MTISTGAVVNGPPVTVTSLATALRGAKAVMILVATVAAVSLY
jgi:hypothetical protein